VPNTRASVKQQLEMTRIPLYEITVPAIAGTTALRKSRTA
jgi:hypothetical protein